MLAFLASMGPVSMRCGSIYGRLLYYLSPENYLYDVRLDAHISDANPLQQHTDCHWCRCSHHRWSYPSIIVVLPALIITQIKRV